MKSTFLYSNFILEASLKIKRRISAPLISTDSVITRILLVDRLALDTKKILEYDLSTHIYLFLFK